MKNRNKMAILLGFCSLMASCTSLKPYEMVYVKDAEMQMGDEAGKKFENYVQSIREGAMPAASQKASGGCGCN
ncbi:MAG: DUF4266 domain-containing protein [Saprospiraceae bacterium]|nr:DUF4266 domain-containing protein [Saprospiraceae bacterium]